MTSAIRLAPIEPGSRPELAQLEGPSSAWSLAEFLANQIGIFGIVLSAALAWRAAAWRREPGDDREKLLLAFSLPVLLAMIGQSVVAQARYSP